MPLPSYFNQVNSLGPKIWYRFNETAGTPVNFGSLTTVSTFNNLLLNEQTDVDGRAIYLNGSTSYIQLPSHPSFSLFDDRSFTVECWVKVLNSDTNTTGPFEIFRLNPPSSPHKTISLTMLGTGGGANRGKIRLSSAWTTDLTSTNALDNGQWHHVVYTFNTSSVKLYIDGVLDKSTTPTNLDASFLYDGSTKKLIGAGYVGTAQTTISQYLKGRIDEFAVYSTELQASDILANYNAGASVEFVDSVGTASSLMVEPTLSLSFNPAAQAPMTADSSFPLPNATMYSQGLDAKLRTYALEQWLKFDLTNGAKPFNEGTGGEIGPDYVLYGTAANFNNLGPNGTAAFKIGEYYENGFLRIDASSFKTDEISDNNFSLGFWFKIDGSSNINRRILRSTNSGQSSLLRIFTDTNGYINFQYGTSASTNTYTGSTDLRNDGQWHYAAMRVDGTDVRYYLDGTEVSALTVTGSRNNNNLFALGFTNGTGDATSSNTGYYYVSNFYIASHTEIDATDIDELWDASRTITEPVQAISTMVQPSVTFFNAWNLKVLEDNPPIAVGFDNATGEAREFNYGTSGILAGDQINSPTKGINTKNRKGYQYTNLNQYDWFTESNIDPSADGYTLALYAKLTNPGQGNVIRNFAFFSETSVPNLFDGQYMIIGVRDDGPFAAYASNSTDLNQYNRLDTANTNLFNDYHLYTITKDTGTNTWKFYVDGAFVSSRSDAGSALPGGGASAFAFNFDGWIGGSGAYDNFIDEFAYFDHSLTAQEVFELWQSITIDRADDVQSTFVMPAIAAGSGPTIAADPMTASALIVMPDFTTEIALSSISLDAFATFPQPNFGGNVVIDANYGQEAATADALFNMPGLSVGGIENVIHFEATALMVQPIAIGVGTIAAPPAIALDGTLVMPGIVTIKGAKVNAEPAKANAIFPLPPAYIQLADDDWYVRLYAGHFDGTKEFLQTTLTSITSGSNTGPVQGGFLTFFDDVSADITTTSSPNTIEGELGQFAYQEPDVFEYDDNGDLVALNTTGTLVRATTSRQSNVPQAILSAGFFDPYERKAVRITNIEFPFPGTGKGFSQRPYNIEFSIKTTKIDQVLAHGFYDQSTSARTIGVVGLSDGKLYLAEDAYKPFTFSFGTGTSGSTTAPHPKNFVNRSQYLIGRTNIADGNWHHVVIQQGFGTETLRTQIWVDGKLDRQIITIGPFPGIDGTNTIRPYILGFNSSDTLLASDFQTSAWNFYPGRFVDSRTISLNYTAYQKSKPIKVEPFTASATTPQNHKAAGNRGRALLLFFWPKTGVLGNRPGSVGQGTIDYGLYGEQDEETFDNTVYTLDLPGIDPEDYYGWDLFPLDVTGTWGTGYTRQSAQSDMLKPGVWTSSDGYRDTNTGARRYLDLMNDIDITQFDAIFFKNFPEQTPELDTNTRDELADVYFGLDESDLYSDFIKSLRAAVDSGVSLYITNATLAKDLGIIDSYEIVSDMSEGGFNPDSTFVNNKFTTTAINEYEYGEWKDTNKNNKFRIVNTLENLTNEPGYIWSDWMYYRPNAELEIGDPNRPYVALVNKPNGLQIGDEFIMSDSSIKTYRYEAVPFDKVKAGKIIAAFSNNINQNGVLSENPFRNYATVIAVEPGTVVNGRPIGGKVLVNFTERLGSHRRDGSRDTLSVDLIQDEWINLAYNTGLIDLAKRNELLTATYNLDRRLEAAIAANNTTQINIINELKYWDSNGDYILVQKNLFDDSTAGGIPKDGIREQRRSRVNKLNKKGTLTTQTTTSSSFFFSFEYSFQYLRLQVTVPSMLTRGFRWLSDKIVLDGTVVRAEPMNNITATAVQPAVSAAKPASINAQAMLANGFITSAAGYAPADIVITTLPAQASISFGQYVKNIRPDVFAANANMRQNVRTVGIQEDEVVVYMIHVDPILYLREDVIK